MKQFISFVKKEFYHITRDVRTMMILLLMPVIQLIIFGYAISTEIKNTPFLVLDHSQTEMSRRLIEKISNNSYFDFVESCSSQQDIEHSFMQGKSKAALVIPPNFGNDIQKTGETGLQIIMDASDPNEATIISNYLTSIILQYQQEQDNNKNVPYRIITESKMLYNPQLKSAYNFVPGIMGMIFMLICAMMTSISIVREKETGTMEVLLVSPVKPISIVLSKAVPYLFISMIDVILILVISSTLLQVPIAGNILLILFLCLLFILSALSLGLLISSIASTQQAAMFVSMGGLMLPTILLSGLVFPIENMPVPLQWFSHLVPARWFIEAIKDVMIKGLGFVTIWKECTILIVMTLILLIVSIKKFKHRL